MAENKKNWDSFIKNATMALGPAGVAAAKLGEIASKEYSAYKSNKQKEESDKYYQSMKGKQKGSAGRESAEKGRASDKEIRKAYRGYLPIDPKTNRLRRPPPPLY